MFDNNYLILFLRMEETNLLKFIAKDKAAPLSTGIRTFPHQTYGVSRESPDYFQRTHTIITPNTYHYQHQQAPQFEYHSQKKSLKLHPVPSQELGYPANTQTHNNPYKYHLKKGRLTQFIDKNGWMNNVYVMNGIQRSINTRKFNNKDRTLRLSKMKEKSEYQSHLIPKPIINNSYYKTLQEIMSEKVRIRARRLKEAQNQLPQTQRSISQQKDRSLEKQLIEKRMATTTKQWYTGSTFGKKRQFSLREGSVGKVDLELQVVDYEKQFMKTQNSGFKRSNFRKQVQNVEQYFQK